MSYLGLDIQSYRKVCDEMRLLREGNVPIGGYYEMTFLRDDVVTREGGFPRKGGYEIMLLRDGGCFGRRLLRDGGFSEKRLLRDDVVTSRGLFLMDFGRGGLFREV